MADRFCKDENLNVHTTALFAGMRKRTSKIPILRKGSPLCRQVPLPFCREALFGTKYRPHFVRRGSLMRGTFANSQQEDLRRQRPCQFRRHASSGMKFPSNLAAEPHGTSNTSAGQKKDRVERQTRPQAVKKDIECEKDLPKASVYGDEARGDKNTDGRDDSRFRKLLTAAGGVALSPLSGGWDRCRQLEKYEHPPSGN